MPVAGDVELFSWRERLSMKATNLNIQPVDVFACLAKLRSRGVLFLLGCCFYAFVSTSPAWAEPQKLVSQFNSADYVDDTECKACHGRIYESYQSVGMANSFMRPSKAKVVEDFEAEPYFHTKSQRYYRIEKSGDELYFERYQLDDKGNKVNQFRRKVDWVMGSGNKARSYLYQNKSGELYLFPLGWYSDGREWAMSPGFDRKEHFGLTRQVRRECMFCHNAYPDVEQGTDAHWYPQQFPQTLPEGIGCQRCHGPGAKHIAVAQKENSSSYDVWDSIVEPGRLSVSQRDAVCDQCHLLPSVDLVGIRQFSRGDYSFKPGEELIDYLLHIDIKDAEVPRHERFEIDHQSYRFKQSQCVQQSGGTFSCTSCHDPHSKPTKAVRIAKYNQVCSDCHKNVEHPKNVEKPAVDCVSCHMPQRRTQDVVHVVMTDHKIIRDKGSADLLQPLEEQSPVIEELDFLMPALSPQGSEGEIYKVITLLRSQVTPYFLQRLETLLQQNKSGDLLPYFDLARAQLLLKRYQDADSTLNKLLKSYPGNQQLLQWLAVAEISLDKYELAYRHLNAVLNANPEHVEVRFNLALAYLKQNKPELADDTLKTTLIYAPEFATAWFYRGKIALNKNKWQVAEKYFLKSLELDPSLSRAYSELIKLYTAQGNEDKAWYYTKLGLQFSLRPEILKRQFGPLPKQPARAN